MKLVCVRCGEPWELTHLVDEETAGGFERQGGLIRRCPACPVHKPHLTPQEQERLCDIATWAPLYGEDVEAFAAMLENNNLV